MSLERVDHSVRRAHRLVDELVELVAVHEVREVRGRLPERHRIVATDGAKQRIGGQVLAHIAGGDGRCAPVLGHHRVPIITGGNTLGARHHVPKAAFDRALRQLDAFHLLKVSGGCAPQRRPEARELVLTASTRASSSPSRNRVVARKSL